MGNKNKPLPEVISAANLETLTGLKDRQLRNIAKQGFFPSPRNGEYEFVKSLKGFIEYKEAEFQKQQGEIFRVKLERQKDQGRKDKVEADKAESSVIDKATGQREATRFAGGLMHRILAVPKRVAQRFALETDPQAIDSFLENELRLAVTDARKFEYGLVTCRKCKTEIQL